MKNGKITISRPYGGEDYVQIQIKDSDSSLKLVELKLTMEDYAYLITGLSEIDCKVTGIISEDNFHKLGKTKYVEYIPIIVEGKNKWDIQKMIKSDPEFLNQFIPFEDGWLLWSDGTKSQQNDEYYKIIICRYLGED